MISIREQLTPGMILIVTGRGKSRNAEALKAFYGRDHIIEEWPGEGSLRYGALVLTSATEIKRWTNRVIVTFEDAMREMTRA